MLIFDLQAAGLPAGLQHFLAGRTDGSISLFTVDDPEPLLSWASFGRGGITQLTW